MTNLITKEVRKFIESKQERKLRQHDRRKVGSVRR